MNITVTINNLRRELAVAPELRVSDLLRREGLLSVRNGCDGEGSCGACCERRLCGFAEALSKPLAPRDGRRASTARLPVTLSRP